MSNKFFSWTQSRFGRLAALVLLVALSACRGETPATPPAPAPAPDQPTAAAAATPSPAPVAPTSTPPPTPVSGEVTLWHSWAGAEGDALNTILAGLQTTLPGVTIQTLFVAPNELTAAYVDAVQSGGGPDLVIAPNWYLGDMVAADATRPLDDLLAEDDRAGFVPATLQSLTVNGALYGLPLTYNLVALYANRSLLPAEGPATTTDALLGTATVSPSAGIGIYANLLHVVWGIPAFGGDFLDSQGRAALDQTDGAARFLTWLVTLDQTSGSYVDQDYGMLLDRFTKREFAYLVDGPWAAGQLTAALDDDLIVVPLPNGPAGPARPWLYSDGLFANPAIPADRLLVVMAVARGLTSADAGTQLATVGGLLPAAQDADLGGSPILAGFAAQAATAAVMPIGPGVQEVWAYGGDMIVKALAGVSPPEQIVAETTALINDAVAP
jgi:arabinogalactan oligomer/maltooligosaccharide transport system substrate-binding protein